VVDKWRRRRSSGSRGHFHIHTSDVMLDKPASYSWFIRSLKVP
jgi:hypothetical protein